MAGAGKETHVVPIPQEHDYDIKEGLVVSWDFIDGLKAKNECVRLKYSIFQGIDQKTRHLETNNQETEFTLDQSSRVATFDCRKQFRQDPKDPSLKVVISIVDGIKNKELGWTVLFLFEKSEHNHIHLRSGCWVTSFQSYNI